MSSAETIRALAVRQPYAELIVSGTKAIENRSWSTAYRGPLLIVAAKKLHESHGLFPGLDAKALPRGGVVGVVDLVGATRASNDPWFCGPVGLLLANARRLPFCPWRGSLHLEAVELSVLELIATESHPAQTGRGAGGGVFDQAASATATMESRTNR